MSLWDQFLHRLWQRVGEPGMQCHGPHVECGEPVTVRFVNPQGYVDDRTGIVNSVTCRGPWVTGIVLREDS